MTPLAVRLAWDATPLAVRWRISGRTVSESARRLRTAARRLRRLGVLDRTRTEEADVLERIAASYQELCPPHGCALLPAEKAADFFKGEP